MSHVLVVKDLFVPHRWGTNIAEDVKAKLQGLVVGGITSFVGHFRKIILLIINFFLNHEIVFEFVGRLNQKFNFLSTVFVAYPATEKYALAYVYPRYRHLMRWRPWPAGIFVQNGKLGLMTVISSLEDDFVNPVNGANLKLLVKRTEKLRRLLGAEQKTFAGILPGVLFAKRIIRETVEAEVTVASVLKAEKMVKDIEEYPSETPLIILGGKGFIGRRLIRNLTGREIYCVDVNGQATNLEAWPFHLAGKKAILINLTRETVLSHYLSLFWSDLVLLNETYPEPKKEELATLTRIGSSVFHIVGVKAKSLPLFPKAYKGGIPCCAARKDEKMEVVVRRLN